MKGTQPDLPSESFSKTSCASREFFSDLFILLISIKTFSSHCQIRLSFCVYVDFFLLLLDTQCYLFFLFTFINILYFLIWTSRLEYLLIYYLDIGQCKAKYLCTENGLFEVGHIVNYNVYNNHGSTFATKLRFVPIFCYQLSNPADFQGR